MAGRFRTAAEAEAAWRARHKWAAQRVAQLLTDLPPSPPVPEPEPIAERHDDPLGRDPTRYGDWELKGIAVDF